jgi:hypothetical protein
MEKIELTHHERCWLNEVKNCRDWKGSGNAGSEYGGHGWFTSKSGAHLVPSTFDDLRRKGLITFERLDRDAVIELTDKGRASL